jgi:hypothetical protein
LTETWLWFGGELGPGLTEGGGEFWCFSNPAGDGLFLRALLRVVGEEGEEEGAVVRKVDTRGPGMHEGGAKGEVKDRDVGRGEEGAGKGGGEEEAIDFSTVGMRREGIWGNVEVSVFVLGGGVERKPGLKTLPFFQKGTGRDCRPGRGGVSWTFNKVEVATNERMRGGPLA